MQNYYKTDLKQQANCWVKSWTKLFPVKLDLMSNEVHETGRQNLLVQLQTGFRHFPIYNWVFRISLGSYTIFLRWSFAIQRFFHILVFQIASTDSRCHSVAVYRLILCPFSLPLGLQCTQRSICCARALIQKGSLWKTRVVLNLLYSASTVNFEGKNDLCSNEHYFSNSKIKASKKKDRFVQALNSWPLRYRCSTLPTELISQLEAGH